MIEQLKLLPGYLLGHINLTLSSLLVGVLISVPLGVWASRVRAVEKISLGVSGVIQTIPSLALLAAMVPTLALLNAPSIGYLPAFLALVLYSILPILRNTVVGLRAVDPAYIEAAKGVGMTSLQRLLRVELPLATPMIIAGIRTSAIWTVGMATLSTPVGAESLGNYIFVGLQTRNTDAILVGCISAAFLSIGLDGLVRIWAKAMEEKRRLLMLGILSVFLTFYGAIAYNLVGKYFLSPVCSVMIGAKSFTEQYIMSEAMADLIEREDDCDVNVRQSLASVTAFDALRSGDIDIYVEYTGTIWSHLMHKKGMPKSRDSLYRDTKEYLDGLGVSTVGRIGFNNTYTLAMRGDDARRLGIETMSDLARYPHLILGGDYEFFGRPEWKALKRAYGLRFDKLLPMDHGLMYQAINDGSVDAIIAFSTDGHIKANDLLMLKDDRQAAMAYDAVILTSSRLKREHPQVLSSLSLFVDAIDEEWMRQLNAKVDAMGESPTQVARELLEQLLLSSHDDVDTR